eukprot:6189124-Pleurochrysis_carterae.AAC.1
MPTKIVRRAAFAGADASNAASAARGAASPSQRRAACQAHNASILPRRPPVQPVRRTRATGERAHAPRVCRVAS